MKSLEYIINSKGFSYNPNRNSMSLTMRDKLFSNILDDEMVNYISDTITHEYLHYIVFNIVKKDYGYDVAKMVTCLFDGIGHHFFEYKKLFDRISKSAGQLTWEVIMGFYGKDEVFRYYGINKKGYMNCLEVFNIHVRESSETGVEGTN